MINYNSFLFFFCIIFLLSQFCFLCCFVCTTRRRRNLSLARQASCLFLLNSVWTAQNVSVSFTLFNIFNFLFLFFFSGFLDVLSSSHRRCSRNCFERFCCARNLNDFFYRKAGYAELFLLPLLVVLVRRRFVLVFSSHGGTVAAWAFLKCCWPQLAAGRNKTEKQKQKEKQQEKNIR